jgi:hypothetical protein
MAIEAMSVTRVIAALQSARLGTAEGRGAAMVAMADAADLIKAMDARLRDVARLVENWNA